MHRVLIVEDEPVLRRTLRRYLDRMGFEVVEAGSVAEAQAEFSRETPDLALLDVGLPDGDGLGLLPHTGVDHSLVITAQPDPERFREHGVVHHLAKPLDLPEVARTLMEIAAA